MTAVVSSKGGAGGARFALPLALVATLAVQSMVLTSWFQDDDYFYFFERLALGAWPSALTPFGNHFLGSFKLLWAALHDLFGANAAWYFRLVLLTHLADVAMLFGIIRALGARDSVAAVAAGLWGVAPALQGTLQWFAAYGMVLSGTTALIALLEIARAKQARRPPTPWAFVRINLALFAGCGTMLGGSVTAAVFPAVAFLLLPKESAPRRAALLIAPGAVLSVFLVAGKSASPLGMGPRFVSVARELWELTAYGIGLVVAGPLVTVHADGHGMGLFRDATAADAVALSAFFAVPCIAAVAWDYFRRDRAERRVILGLLLIPCAVYGAVSLGRTGVGVAHEWIATRDRYHYATNLGLVVCLGLAGDRLFPRRSPLSSWPAAALALLAAIALLVQDRLVAKKTYMGRQDWVHHFVVLIDEAVEAMARKTSNDETLYVENEAFKPAGLVYGLGMPRYRFPGIGAYWLIAHGDKAFGHPIRFVEKEATTLGSLREWATPDVAAMFVSPGEATRAGAVVLTIAESAPREVASALASSIDPLFQTDDFRRAVEEALRKSRAQGQK